MATIKLKDYLIYPATFVRGAMNEHGEHMFSAKIHTSQGDFSTAGTSFENTVKRARSMIVDMAHVLAFEDHIPSAASFKLLQKDISRLDLHELSVEHPLLPQTLVASFEEQEKEGHVHSLSLMSLAGVDTHVDEHTEVAIELSVMDAWRIIICNEMYESEITYKSLAKTLGKDRESIEESLNFYNTEISCDLESILSVLGVRLSLEQ